MGKKEIIERINSILNKVDDEKVLREIYNLIFGIYKHFVSGNWER